MFGRRCLFSSQVCEAGIAPGEAVFVADDIVDGIAGDNIAAVVDNRDIAAVAVAVAVGNTPVAADSSFGHLKSQAK